MNTFIVVLTVMAAQLAPVPANQPVTLQPDATISMTGATAKAAATSCARVQKALAAGGIIAFCSPKAAEVKAAEAK